MRGDGLTEIQLRVIRFLRSHRERHGYYATVRDVQKYMGWSAVSTAHECLLRLEKKGRVERRRLTRDTVVFMTVE